MMNLKKILVVGKNSFIGKKFFDYSNLVDIVSHTEIEHVNFNQYDSVLNCSINPDYKNNSYQENNDFDFLVYEKCLKNNCHYVMLSTRKVYGKSDTLKKYDEKSETNPFDHYSHNKLITEEKIKKYSTNYTILRGSNVFGEEYDRQSFMGFCLTQLKNNDRIIFDVDGSVRRDFISVKEVSKILEKVCRQKKTGIFNLSSNFALAISEIPRLLIIGKKSGEFQDGNKITDQFVLDNNLISKTFEVKIKSDYTEDFIEIGKTLCKI